MEDVSWEKDTALANAYILWYNQNIPPGGEEKRNKSR
jgi:hypothetical protein